MSSLHQAANPDSPTDPSSRSRLACHSAAVDEAVVIEEAGVEASVVVEAADEAAVVVASAAHPHLRDRRTESSVSHTAAPHTINACV